jgi:hypothetical protein
MKCAAGLMLGLGLLMSGCLSRDEVLRVTSPDGRVDAIAFETDCGQRVRSATKSGWHHEGAGRVRKLPRSMVQRETDKLGVSISNGRMSISYR